jgi:hypothetical protein
MTQRRHLDGGEVGDDGDVSRAMRAATRSETVGVPLGNGGGEAGARRGWGQGGWSGDTK